MEKQVIDRIDEPTSKDVLEDNMISPLLKNNQSVTDFIEYLHNSGFEENKQDFVELIKYVDTVEKKYDAILTELNALKEQLGEIHDKKNPMFSVVKDTQEKVIDIGQKLNALKDNIITFTQNALETVKEKGLVALNEVTGFLKIKDGLQLLNSSLDKMAAGAEKSVQKINAISNEYHEMGNRAANIGRLLLDKESSLVVKENGKLAKALQLPFTKIQNYSEDLSAVVRKSIEKVQGLENYVADKEAQTIQVDEKTVLKERDTQDPKAVEDMNAKEQEVSAAKVNHAEQQPLSGISGNLKAAQGNNVFVLSEQGYLHRAAKGLKDIKPGQSFPEYKNKVPKSWAEKGWVKEVSPDALSEIQQNQIHRSATASTIRPAVNIGLEP